MKKILTFKNNETTYGVLYDEIIAVNTVHSISRLPLVPDYIAGMAKINGRTVPLADLSVCMGLPPLSRKKDFHIITVSDTANATSFIVEGTTTDILVPPVSVLPVHDYLKSKIINRYVQYDDTVIPIINISYVYGELQNGKSQPVTPEYRLPLSNMQQSKSLRCFKVNKQVFVGIADRFFDIGLPLATPAQLPGLKNFVTGFIHDQGLMLPIINLSEYLGTNDDNRLKTVIKAEIQGHFFGFQVTEDMGAIQPKDSALKLLPPLMQSRLVQYTLKVNNKFVPVLNLREYLQIETNNYASHRLSNPTDHDSVQPTPPEGDKAYGEIDRRYGKEPLEVVELSVGEYMHALPSCEVSEWFPALDFQSFPTHRPVVIGITEYKNKLMPVLDPAVCFDSQTSLKNNCDMILIEKEAFSALIITNKTNGKKQLPVELQRELPVEQSFNFFYGCYPDKNNVRLILNMEVITLNFLREMASEFYCTSRVNYACNHEEEEKTLQDVSPIESSIQYPENQICDDFILSNVTRQTRPVALISYEEPAVVDASENFTPLEIQMEEPEKNQPENNQPEDNQSDPKLIVHHTIISGIIKNTPFQTQETATHHTPLTQIQPSTLMLNSTTLPEPSPWSGTSAFNPPAPLAPDKPGRTNYTTLKTSSPDTKEFPKDTTDKNMVYTAVDEPNKITNKTHHIGFPNNFNEPVPEWQSMIPKKKKMWPLILPATLSILFFMVYLNMNEQKISVQKKNPVDQRRVIPNKIENLQIPIKTNKTPLTKEAAPEKKLKTNRVPVTVVEKKTDFIPQINEVPDAPPEVATEPEFEAYNVVKGDSLWKISKRFTGSGFNFQDLARDNYIDDPDLIFPEQTILIKNKKLTD